MDQFSPPPSLLYTFNEFMGRKSRGALSWKPLKELTQNAPERSLRKLKKNINPLAMKGFTRKSHKGNGATHWVQHGFGSAWRRRRMGLPRICKQPVNDWNFPHPKPSKIVFIRMPILNNIIVPSKNPYLGFPVRGHQFPLLPNRLPF